MCFFPDEIHMVNSLTFYDNLRSLIKGSFRPVNGLARKDGGTIGFATVFISSMVPTLGGKGRTIDYDFFIFLRLKSKYIDIVVS